MKELEKKVKTFTRLKLSADFGELEIFYQLTD